MDDHVKNKCSRRDLDCHFKCAGCKVRKPKPELERHMKEAVSIHLSMVTGLKFTHKKVRKGEGESGDEASLHLQSHHTTRDQYTGDSTEHDI